LLLLAVGVDLFLDHHELRPSVGPVLNPYPHNGVCVYVYVCTRSRCTYMHMRVKGRTGQPGICQAARSAGQVGATSNVEVKQST